MTQTRPHSAVLLMSYGTPASRADVLAYYTDIRRGRPPSDEQLADLVRRYDAIGGLSPLAERTEAQRAALQHGLDTRAPGEFRVVLGTKHSAPSIEDAVATVAAAGIDRIVALVLAPHRSGPSIGEYMRRVRAAAEPVGITVAEITSWATEPAFVEFIASDLTARLPTDRPSRVVFTAHSLPARIVAEGDPYPDELRATAEAVAAAAGLSADVWQIGWQSAGRTPEPWLGPDILTVIDSIAAEGRVDAIVVAAVGFVADHLEVLYDLDIEAAGHAAGRGIGFDRTRCVNDDETVMAALAGLVVGAADRPAPSNSDSP